MNDLGLYRILHTRILLAFGRVLHTSVILVLSENPEKDINAL